MKPKKVDNRQKEIFKNRLSEELNPRHELVKLGHRIPWDVIEKELGEVHVDNGLGGQPPKPVRLMVGLMLLQNMNGLSDEAAVALWIENPYWQYFCGYDYLQWEMPIDPSSLTRWRKRLGSEKIERILALTVTTAVRVKMVKEKDLATTIADTTVMCKNIEFPTDSRLLNKSRKRLVELAKEHGLELRQNYNLVCKRLERKIGGYFHAKQMKRGNKAVKQLRTFVGRVYRDIERKISGNESLREAFRNELDMCNHLITRTKQSKKKLYSLHESGVECIRKGKRHKQYEFGCKVALMIPHAKGNGLIIGCKAVHGNPYDGHTLQSSIEQTERITKVKVKESYLDRGYKGNDAKDVQTFISGQRRGISKVQAKKLKRRSAIEPHIGHMKKIGKLGLCRLKGKLGDEINATLAAAGYNMKLILNYLRNYCPKIYIQLFNLFGRKFISTT